MIYIYPTTGVEHYPENILKSEFQDVITTCLKGNVVFSIRYFAPRRQCFDPQFKNKLQFIMKNQLVQLTRKINAFWTRKI